MSHALRTRMTDQNRNKPKPGLAGGSYGANEREQTEDIERARHAQPDEAGEFVTDAETEVREANGEIGGDRNKR